MSYLNDFKRMAVGREMPRLNEADDKTAKVNELISTVQSYYRSLDAAYGEMPSEDNFDDLLKDLKGVIPDDKLAQLKAAISSVGIGRAMDALDNTRIALKVALDPEYLSKANKPSKKRKVK